jgi:shikimate dehydrogenase
MIEQVKYGLVGKNISYSFSKNYFYEKFSMLQLQNFIYENFDMQSIDSLPVILNENRKSLKGLNITIPFKEEVFKYLDEVDDEAKTIGAVNTIKILDNYRLKGYNTDIYGFENSLKPILQKHMKRALILGTGGASKAVAFVLNKLEIAFKYVSRNPENKETITYQSIDDKIIKKYHLIINCTPLGTFPEIEKLPDLPYEKLTNKHLLYDLIYNPSVSSFLQKGRDMGVAIKNGQEMLELQADRSWEIWNT